MSRLYEDDFYIYEENWLNRRKCEFRDIMNACECMGVQLCTQIIATEILEQLDSALNPFRIPFYSLFLSPPILVYRGGGPLSEKSSFRETKSARYSHR